MRETALEAAEAVIRRHGADRARIVDIAAAIGVNHALLYRHFKDKAALIDAVSERWLAGVERDLGTIVAQEGEPVSRLKRWFAALYATMRDRRHNDPELFDSFHRAWRAGRPFVTRHGTAVRWQLAKLVTAAMQSGRFRDGNPLETAMLLFDATMAYHHPALIDEQTGTDRQAGLQHLLDGVTEGLQRQV